MEEIKQLPKIQQYKEMMLSGMKEVEVRTLLELKPMEVIERLKEGYSRPMRKLDESFSVEIADGAVRMRGKTVWVEIYHHKMFSVIGGKREIVESLIMSMGEAMFWKLEEISKHLKQKPKA
jgi:hypothetical protein